MIEVNLDNLKQGMVLADDFQDTVLNMRLTKGFVLTERYVSFLKRIIVSGERKLPITNESYNLLIIDEKLKIESEQTMYNIEGIGVDAGILSKYNVKKAGNDEYIINDNLEIHDTLSINGNVLINGNVTIDNLFISGNLTINGIVTDTNIEAKGNIEIGGAVINSKRCKINSLNEIKLMDVNNAEIKSDTVEINGIIQNCEIIAENNIKGPGTTNIKSSKLRAGMTMYLGSVLEETSLIILSTKLLEVTKRMLQFAERINKFKDEIAPLQQSINILKYLKNKVNQLPAEKREKLIADLKILNVKLQKKQFYEEQYISTKVETENIKKAREKNVITIENEIKKGTKVLIDNSSMDVQVNARNVVFYKKGMIIMGKKDRQFGVL